LEKKALKGRKEKGEKSGPNLDSRQSGGIRVLHEKGVSAGCLKGKKKGGARGGVYLKISSGTGKENSGDFRGAIEKRGRTFWGKRDYEERGGELSGRTTQKSGKLRKKKQVGGREKTSRLRKRGAQKWLLREGDFNQKGLEGSRPGGRKEKASY